VALADQPEAARVAVTAHRRADDRRQEGPGVDVFQEPEVPKSTRLEHTHRFVALDGRLVAAGAEGDRQTGDLHAVRPDLEDVGAVANEDAGRLAAEARVTAVPLLRRHAVGLVDGPRASAILYPDTLIVLLHDVSAERNARHRPQERVVIRELLLGRRHTTSPRNGDGSGPARAAGGGPGWASSPGRGEYGAVPPGRQRRRP